MSEDRPFHLVAGRDPAYDSPPPVDLGAAYYNQRHALRQDKDLLLSLWTALASPGDLTAAQLAQLYATTLEFRPDVVLELGRGSGNSTVAFTQAIHRAGAGRLVSIDFDEWTARERIRGLVPRDWFDPLELLVSDIRALDHHAIVEGAGSVLVLWDAHGFEVAEVVLGSILPAIAERQHYVIIHDITDNRLARVQRAYSGPIWKGSVWHALGPNPDARVNLGWLNSAQDQVVALADFLARNDLTPDSADEAYQLSFDEGREREMLEAVGPHLFSKTADWIGLSLTGKRGPFFFPPAPPLRSPGSRPRVTTQAPTGNAPFLRLPGRDAAGDAPPPIDIGEAYYEQRHALREDKSRLLELIEAVGWANDLSTHQWAQWYATTLSFRPDLVLEIGRGRGNSTALFCQAIDRLGSGRVVSIDHARTWPARKRIGEFVPGSWFQPLDLVAGDAAAVDYPSLLREHHRVLVLWDAHGFQIAEVVLGAVLPAIADVIHCVILHDISDNRYVGAPREYDAPLWRGSLWQQLRGGPEARLNIGWMNSAQDQLVALADFLTRNDLELESSDQAYRRTFGGRMERIREMLDTVGEDFFSLDGDWAALTLSGKPGPFHFPPAPDRTRDQRRLDRRVRRRLARLLYPK